MAPEVIGFFILVAILAVTITGALGMYLAGEKGASRWHGFFIGAVFSLFGLLWIAIFVKPSDANIVTEMYDRDMMDLPEYEKTMEFKVNKK